MFTVEPGSAIPIDAYARALLDQFIAEAEETDLRWFMTAMEKAYRCGVAHARHRESAPLTNVRDVFALSDARPTCRLCLDPCRFFILDAVENRRLPGYCERHGQDMLRPLTTPAT